MNERLSAKSRSASGTYCNADRSGKQNIASSAGLAAGPHPPEKPVDSTQPHSATTGDAVSSGVLGHSWKVKQRQPLAERAATGPSASRRRPAVSGKRAHGS